MSQTNEYPSLGTPPAGSIRFNTDSAKMEIYNGEQWWEIDSTSPEQRTGGTRALFIGSDQGNMIDFINISTTGNAADFGDIYINTSNLDGSSDRTRAVFSGGYSNEITKLQIESQGNSSDFGDLTLARGNISVSADRTRAVFMGGFTHPSPTPAGVNVIDYVTVQSEGNAVDFGDMRDTHYEGMGFSSPTRGFVAGADSTPGTIGKGEIDYITISTLGNSAKFGDTLTDTRWQRSCAANAIRGLIMGGRQSPTETNTIEFITMASLGNALDFGDLTRISRYQFAAASSTRIVNAGGYSAPTSNNTIDYVQIMTTGDAVDFGDLTAAKNKGASASNGHGGLG